MKHIIFDQQKVIPSKVVCIGRNYVEHIKELNNEIPSDMVIFNKPNSSISDTLRYSDPDCRFEGELCLLIKESKLAGLGLGLDLTHAALQNRLKHKGLPWERAKAFDGSAVLSAFVPFEGALNDLHFELYHNHTLAQHAHYDLMMYKPDEIIEKIQQFMTLEEYDIVMTGTPKGVGTYQKDDRFEMKLFHQDKLLLRSIWRVK